MNRLSGFLGLPGETSVCHLTALNQPVHRTMCAPSFRPAHDLMQAAAASAKAAREASQGDLKELKQQAEALRQQAAAAKSDTAAAEQVGAPSIAMLHSTTPVIWRVCLW